LRSKVLTTSTDILRIPYKLYNINTILDVDYTRDSLKDCRLIPCAFELTLNFQPS